MTKTIIDVAETFDLNQDMALTGVSPLRRRQYSPQRKQQIAEAARLWGRVFAGDRRAGVLVQEALSTSDLFKSVTGDVLDREILARYSDITPSWPMFATRTTVRNFKPKKLIDFLGGRSRLDRVPELSEYPEVQGDNEEYEISVKKFGRRFSFSWEAMINDDLDELEVMPSRFASAAALTETYAALDVIANADGTANTDFWKAGNDNAPTSGVLNHDNLQAAITEVSTTKLDAEGNLLTPTGGLILVVGPAQQFNAERVLNSTELRTTVGGETVIEPNPLRGKIKLVVIPELRGTAWFILPAPGGDRPALAVAFLRGYETPDIRQKANAGQGVDPDQGDFEDDSIHYRVRHVTGGAALVPTFTAARTGA